MSEERTLSPEAQAQANEREMLEKTMEEVVTRWVEQNSYSKLRGALPNTSPKQWQAQVDRAEAILRELLEEKVNEIIQVVTDVDQDLHQGNFEVCPNVARVLDRALFEK